MNTFPESCLFETPILLIIYNRPEITEVVFEKIKLIKPKNLYIAADGPKDVITGDDIKCSQTRNIVINGIDWECKVKTLFREVNIGCGRGVSEAISWFFEHVNEGIILEDDCLPNDSFFKFCEENLDRYRFNGNISIVSGNNFQLIQPMPIESDYYFSVFPSTWGWATWKRVWDNYDLEMKEWELINQIELLNFIFKEERYKDYWKKTFNKYYLGKGEETWDFQFYFHCMKRKQLAIIPKLNLVSNIGHGMMATHTKDVNSYFSKLKCFDLEFPLKHPKTIQRNYDADIFIQKTLFGEAEIVTPWRKLKRSVKHLIKYKQ